MRLVKDIIDKGDYYIIEVSYNFVDRYFPKLQYLEEMKHELRQMEIPYSSVSFLEMDSITLGNNKYNHIMCFRVNKPKPQYQTMEFKL